MILTPARHRGHDGHLLFPDLLPIGAVFCREALLTPQALKRDERGDLPCRVLPELGKERTRLAVAVGLRHLFGQGGAQVARFWLLSSQPGVNLTLVDRCDLGLKRHVASRTREQDGEMRSSCRAECPEGRTFGTSWMGQRGAQRVCRIRARRGGISRVRS